MGNNNKLLLIIRREYLAKVRNKSFIVMTFLSPVLMVAMVALVVFLARVNNDEKKTIAILDESSLFSGIFEPVGSVGYVEFQDISFETAKDSVSNANYLGLLYIPSGSSMEQVAQGISFFSNDPPSINILSKIENKIEDKIKEEKLKSYGVPAEDLENLYAQFEIRTESFSGQQNLKGITEFKAIIGGGFGYLIMMFIIIYGAFVMRSVIEEKTSRIIEVIISSVKPFDLMLGKIIGTSLAGITQFVIWTISAGILSFIVLIIMGVDSADLSATSNLTPGATDALNSIPENEDIIRLYVQEILGIPWITLFLSFLIYFILGYLIYSSIYAAIGAAVDNETDTQQFMFPVITPLMLAIYVGFFSVFDNPHGPIAVGFSLFPLTSPIVMLMRLPAGIGEGGVPWWQFILSLFFLIVTFMFIVWLAARIYRVGILMYGKKPTYKELYKWLKY
ncbi:ABC transporter permease [Ascidiimonas sp. W6]|uniref:ABC transporter permease n=1 Tax=Ascidiimonas meishanensis TaxID=3128903 RepID=UPI0030EDAE88